MAKSRRMYEQICKSGVKFGGQNPWVPYFWEVIVDYDLDAYNVVNGVKVYQFEVNEYEVRVFPELKVGQVITLHDDGDCVVEIDPEEVIGAKR